MRGSFLSLHNFPETQSTLTAELRITKLAKVFVAGIIQKPIIEETITEIVACCFFRTQNNTVITSIGKEKQVVLDSEA